MYVVRTLTLMALCLGIAPAQGLLLDTHTVVGLGQVSAALISPDGARVAILTSRARGANEPDGTAQVELSMVDFESGALRPFSSEGRFSGLSWSGDSQALHFSGRRGGSKLTQVHALPVDGGEAQALFEPQGSVRDYALSADGTQAAYTCLAPDPADRTKDSAKGFDREVVDEEIRSVELHLVNLATGEDRKFELDGAPWELAFSPDGRRLAVYVSPRPTTDHRYMYRRLQIINLDDSSVVRVENPGKVGDFAWSPDGHRIAFWQVDTTGVPEFVMINDTEALYPTL
ncbi:MAG: PD40 domain-containing protein, partial [Planctomycetes bacterium]|nr:PD40 domain-containing protein [Planctomycetota bacterium]